MIVKTLVFKDEDIIKSLGRYAHILNKSFAAGELPQLMKKEATIEALKKLYPDNNWSDVKIIKLEINEL